jgi:hypothetical protein
MEVKSKGLSDDIVTVPSVDAIALIEAIRAEGVASRQEEAREDRAKKAREWITIGLVACTLVAIVYQVGEMIRVYEPIHEQAVASLDAAAAAIRQAESSERIIMESQRAWLGAKRVSLSAEPKADGIVDVTIDFENTGREPARNFDFIILPHLQLSDDKNSYDDDAEFMRTVSATCAAMTDSNRGFVVFPGAVGRIESPDYWTRISPEHLQKTLETGQSGLSITGCFTYSTFGAVHHTSFCYWYKKGVTDFRNLRICGGAHQIAD